MSETPRPCEPYCLTLSAVVADAAEPDSAADLEAHLAACANCRQRASAFYRQDRALTELAVHGALVDQAALRIRQALQLAPAQSGAPKNLGAPRNTSRRPAARRALAWAALAAGLLILGGLWQLSRSPATPASARVDSLTGSVYRVTGTRREPVQPGDLLPDGGRLETEGDESSASVAYPDGTQLALGADTTVVLHDPQPAQGGQAAVGKRVNLTEGFLSADVAPQPPRQPMILSTPQAELVVLGTRFQLAGGSESTYVKTRDGTVRVTRTRDGQSVLVAGGFETAVGGPEQLRAAPSLPTTWGPPRESLDQVFQACLSRAGDVLAASSYLHGQVEFRRLDGGQAPPGWTAHRQRIHAVAFSPDGALLATASLDATVKLWDFPSGRLRHTLAVSPGWIADAAFSPDGRSLCVVTGEEGAEQRQLLRFDVASGSPRGDALAFSSQRFAFSPSGRWLASYDRGRKLLEVWDLAAGARRSQFPGPVGNNVFALAISPDDRLLAVDGSSGVVVLCDLATGQVRQRLQRLGGRIFGLAFSPDQRTLATGHQDGTLRLAELATGRQWAVSPGREAVHARALGFTPDGRWLLTRDTRLATAGSPRGGAVQLWNVPIASEEIP